MAEDVKKEAHDDVPDETDFMVGGMEPVDFSIPLDVQPHGSPYGTWGKFFAVLGMLALAAAGVFAGLAWGDYGAAAGKTAPLFEGPFKFVIAAGGMVAVFALSRFYQFALNEAEADVLEAQAHSVDIIQDLMKIKNLVERGRDDTLAQQDIAEPRAAG